MGSNAMQLPRIDFSDIDLSAPGDGVWPAVRAQVVDALATFGYFDAHYPALTPDLRAALLDGAIRPLFALPADVKRRNYVGPELPFHGYLGGRPGVDGCESLAIVDVNHADHIRAFADLMWPDGDVASKARFCEAVHGASKRIVELEAAVRRMVMEGLGVAKSPAGALSDEATWHQFRMAEYKAANAAEEKVVRFGSHQDANFLSVVCQHEVDGLEMQTKDGEWIPVKLTPTSLVVMVGNTLRAWTNERLHSPFHRVTGTGDVIRHSGILFSIPKFNMIQAPDELVDDEHPPRFKPYDYEEFVRFCVSEEGARHEDKLKAYCGV